MMVKKDVKNNTRTRLSVFLICLFFVFSLFSCNNHNVKFIPKQFVEENIKQEIKKSKNCSVQVFVYRKDRRESWGSGIVVSPGGLILTAKHVVKDANSIQVKSNNGIFKPAEILYIDDKEDFAFIKVNANCEYETFGKFSDVEIGDWVYIIGTPLDKDLFNTVIYGSVSALDRKISYFSADLLLQLDANIEGGHSGGAVFNMKGEIVGIVIGKYIGTSITICTPICSIINRLEEITAITYPNEI